MPSAEEDASQPDLVIADEVFKMPPGKPARLLTGPMFEREQACANAIEGARLPNIEIPVVYVSARINGSGGVFNETAADAAITELNAVYARAGFSFRLVYNYTVEFETLAEAQPDIETCLLEKPVEGCARCNAYKAAPEEYQTPETLFIYAVPPEGER